MGAATFPSRKRAPGDVRRDGQHDLAEELAALFGKH